MISAEFAIRPRQRCPFAGGAALALLATLSVAAPGVLRAQRHLVGRTVDSVGVAIPRVRVTVDGAFVESESGSDGVFRLSIGAGMWILRAHRIGYRPAEERVVVEPVGGVDTVRFTLTPAPNQLRGITVVADAIRPMTVTATAANVRQLPALGEPDILRVLPFLPGVQQPNDLRAAVYLAGAASDETAMRLDGFRLQWPTHLNGLFGPFAVGAIDHADVSIHRLPPSVDGAVGGIIDFSPRAVEARAEGDAALSLLSASGTLATPAPLGTDILVSGRATYAAQLADRLVGRGRAEQSNLRPPAFGDFLARASWNWAGGLTTSALVYATQDHQPPSANGGEPLTWGERLGGATAAFEHSGWHIEGRASADEALVRFTDPEDAARRIDVRQRWDAGAVELRHVATWARVDVGAQLDVRHHADHWNTTAASSAFGNEVPFHYDTMTSLLVGAAYAEIELQPAARWTANAGLRTSFTNARSYLAPRFLLEHELNASWRLSASLERRYQFDAQLGPVGDGSVAQPTFLLDRPRTADLAAISTAWQSSIPVSGLAAQATMSVYGRRYPDRAIAPSFSATDTVVPGFPGFARVAGGAYGAAVGGTVSSPRGFVVQASYTAQNAWSVVGGEREPTPWDIRHSLAVFAGLPTVAGWALTSAAQFHNRLSNHARGRSRSSAAEP